MEGIEVQNPLDAEMMKGRPDWSLAAEPGTAPGDV
jgi:hypothetical protein